MGILEQPFLIGHSHQCPQQACKLVVREVIAQATEGCCLLQQRLKQPHRSVRRSCHLYPRPDNEHGSSTLAGAVQRHCLHGSKKAACHCSHVSKKWVPAAVDDQDSARCPVHCSGSWSSIAMACQQQHLPGIVQPVLHCSLGIPVSCAWKPVALRKYLCAAVGAVHGPGFDDRACMPAPINSVSAKTSCAYSGCWVISLPGPVSLQDACVNLELGCSASWVANLPF